MSRIDHHPQPRFAGYTADLKKGEAKLWLPGHHQLKAEKVFAEVIRPGESSPTPIPMERDEKRDYWVPSKDVSVPLGTDYRFYVADDTYKGKQTPSITAYPKDKDPGPSQANLKPTGNERVWEFDNPLPTKGVQTLELPISDFNTSLPWRLERLDKGQEPVGISSTWKTYQEDNKEKTKLVFTDKNAAATSRYRLSPGLDMGEVVERGSHGSFNRISSLESTSPQKSPGVLDLFQDSALARDQITVFEDDHRAKQKLGNRPEERHIPQLEMRNPNNKFAMQRKFDKDGKPLLQEAGLKEAIGIASRAGLRGVLPKSSVGGDKQSSHGYWTEDSYGLNPSFSSKEAFRDVAGALTGLDMKPIADGAFVNMGLTSVHQSANRAYGLDSPYWRWFKHGDEAINAAPAIYPQQARDKTVYGVLPTKEDHNGYAEQDLSNLGVRVINDPEDTTKTYDPKKPTYIQPYDKRLEKPNRDPADGPKPKILKSTDSVQSYKFEIDPSELKGRDRSVKNMLEWKKFRLDIPARDNSGAKWDGQIDTALLNTRNPEVVNYLKGAVTYWTRFVMNTNVRNVTHAMLQAQAEHRKTPNSGELPLADLVGKVTQTEADQTKFKNSDNPRALLNKDGAFEKILKNRPLPFVTNPAIETMSEAELKQIADSVAPDHSEDQNGKAFAKRLLKEVPMDVLPLPTLFKASLSYPGLEQALTTANRGKFARFMSETVLGNLARIPVLGRIFQGIRNYFYPRPFQKELAHKMQEIFKQLTPEVKNRLRYGNVQSLLADQVGEVLYLSLFTGLQPEQIKEKMKDPAALEQAFYAGMPAHILHADPVTASKFIPALLAKRLKDLSPKQMGNLVEAEVQQLDPKLAAVAQAVLNQRELGLNWRIDAAKDVGDMSRIKEAPNHERAKIFEEEFDYVMKFWGKMSGAIREVFPKTTIIPEMTDLELLSGESLKGKDGAAGKAALARVKKKLFEGGVFNGMPNMRYGFSAPKQLVHYDPEPHKYGQSQITLGQFQDNLREYVESLPRPVVRNMQNMTSSHDFITDSHNLLINPQLFHMDKEKSRGLKEDLIVSIDELQHKICFDAERNGLELTDVNKSLNALKALMLDTGFKERITDREMKGSLDQATKATGEATPFQLKADFVDKLFTEILQPEELGLKTRDEMKPLQAALKARILEPSEAKAMRGAIVNATEKYLEQRTAPDAAQKLSEADANKIRQAIWPALKAATQPVNEGGWGRHFGYQPLEFTLNHVFDHVKAESLPNVENGPIKVSPEEVKEQLKLGIYDTASKDVMDKLQRLYALHVATPGMPSIYMHDLLAQYGAESKNNTYLQNRNILRTDKLDKGAGKEDGQFLTYFQQMTKLLNARTKESLQALSDGEILPVTPDEQSGIMPIVRDNGKQQVITLVNVGAMPTDETEDEKKKRGNAEQPLQPLNWLHKAGEKDTYSMPERIRKTEGQQINLSELKMRPGTRYRDVNPNKNNVHEEFVLDTAGILQPAGDGANKKAGIQVDNWRMLERVN